MTLDGDSYVVRTMRVATAGALLAVGLVVVIWAGYAYAVAAQGGAGDLTATGWSIYATVGLVVGGGFLYLAWLASGRGRPMPRVRVTASEYLLAAGLVLLLLTLLVGVPGRRSATSS